MAGKAKKVHDDQQTRLKQLLAAANARYRTLLKNRETITEASRAFDSILELERMIALQEHRTGDEAQGPDGDCQRGHEFRCIRCGTEEGVFKVRYEDPDPPTVAEEIRRDLVGSLQWLSEQPNVPGPVIACCGFIFGWLSGRELPEGYSPLIERFAQEFAALEEMADENVDKASGEANKQLPPGSEG